VIKLSTIESWHAEGLAELQHICFPTVANHELLQEEHFLNHCKLFPEGNFVLLDGTKVVGLGSGFLINFDFDDAQHSFKDIIADGFYSKHNPEGEWYYGADISVHPEYRRKGLARRLYTARKNVVKKLNRKGIVAGGLIPTYAKFKKKMTVEAYVEKVIAGEIFGRTLSVQLRNGFKVKGLLENYIEDTASDNWSTLIVWDNPDYLP